LDKNTGKLDIGPNTIKDKSYTFNITVYKTDNTTYNNITGTIYLGYRAPALGDYAYSDGTFS
jgi:hypothetical protein